MTLVLRSLCLLFPLLFIVTPALAQDASARARAEFGRGVSRYEAGDYQGALEAFQEAYRLAPHPSVRVNMANSYEQLDRPLEAMFHFERFLAEAENIRPDQRREVEAALERLRGRVGEVTLSIEPAGATVVIDGSETRTAPIAESIRMMPGNHTLEVTAPGYAPVQRELIVEPGQPATINVSLSPATSDAAEPQQAAAAEGEAGASAELPPPSYEDDRGGGLTLTTPVIIAGGATAALLLGAVVTGVAALGANSDFDDAVVRCNRGADPAACDEGRDAADSASTLALVTDILLVAGLVGAGVTAYLVATQDGTDEARARRLSVTPVASPTGGALVVSGAL